MTRRFAVLAMALLIAGCSTIYEGAHEEVTLTTPGVTGARCQVENGYFRYIINPPRTFKLERTTQPYKITCLAPGNRIKTAEIKAGYEDTAFWNALNGVIPGFSIDAVSGALFAYEHNIVVDFTGMKPSPMPLPDYQIMLQENPLMKGMEEFRPGIPALQRDENTVITPMQPRAPDSYNDFNTLDSGGSNAKSAAKENTGSSVPVPLPQKPVSTGGSIAAETLTKATNPRVFGKRNIYMKNAVPRFNDDPDSGFAGGTSTPATTTPEPLSQ